MLEEIVELQRAGRLEEAEERYREVLAFNPDDPEALHLLGMVRRQRGDLGEALALVQQAVQLQPERWTYHHTLGGLLLHARQFDESEQHFRKALELNPNLANAHSGLGQIAMLRGDSTRAEEHFKIALRANADDSQVLNSLGNLYMERGDVEMAVQYLSRAAELRADDPAIQASLGRALLVRGTPEFALRAFENALKLKPDYAVAQLLSADSLLRLQRLEEAHAAFVKLRDEFQDHRAAALAGIGDIARLRRRHAEAVTEYDRALELDDTLDKVAAARAGCLAQQGGGVEAAIESLRAWLARRPQADAVRAALARMLRDQRRPDEAVQLWRAAVEQRPDEMLAQAELAVALDRTGKWREAEAIAERLSNAAVPDDHGLQGDLALIRARADLLGDNAARARQRLLALQGGQLQPAQARVRHHLLGLAQDRLGHYEQAVLAFREAHRIQKVPLPELPDVCRLRESLCTLAEEPPLSEPPVRAPILLIGLPGSGVRRVAALLADQEGVVVRRDRFTGAVDFLADPNEPRLLRSLNQSELRVAARRYARAAARAAGDGAARIIDWLPHLDARVLPVLRRALPGARIVIVDRDPRHALINWLAFGWGRDYQIDTPESAAHWLRQALDQQDLAADILPSLRVDADELLSNPTPSDPTLSDPTPDDPTPSDRTAGSTALAELLGLDALRAGSSFERSGVSAGALPTAFEAGHVEAYAQALDKAYAVLQSR